MSETNGERRARAQRAPRVIHLPSPRRLLRPEPALLLAGLVLVGAMNAPVEVGAGAGGGEAASTTQVTVAPGADSLRWFDQAERRERGDRLRAMYAVPLASAAGATTAELVGPVASAGPFRVPDALWAAYTAAAKAMPASCNLDPRLLAAIGQVESGSLTGRGLDARHRAVPGVFGPVLDGGPYASIRDTDDGRWDGDPTWDRAVGPMQFIPSTWSRHGRDADGDGVADPQDVEDAALSAAGYLCAGGRDLARAGDLRAAILSYNHSESYLAAVLALVPGAVPGGGIVSADGVQSVTSVPPAPTAAPPAPTAAPPPAGSPSPPTTTTSASTASPTSSSASRTSSTTTSPTSSSTTTPPTATTTTSPTATTTTTSPTATTTTTSPTATTTTTPATATTTTPDACGTASPTPTTTGTTTSTPTTTATTTGTTTSTATATGTCTPAPTASPTPSPSTSSANATEKALGDEATPTAG